MGSFRAGLSQTCLHVGVGGAVGGEQALQEPEVVSSSGSLLRGEPLHHRTPRTVGSTLVEHRASLGRGLVRLDTQPSFLLRHLLQYRCPLKG